MGIEKRWFFGGIISIYVLYGSARRSQERGPSCQNAEMVMASNFFLPADRIIHPPPTAWSGISKFCRFVRFGYKVQAIEAFWATSDPQSGWPSPPNHQPFGPNQPSKLLHLRRWKSLQLLTYVRHVSHCVGKWIGCYAALYLHCRP